MNVAKWLPLIILCIVFLNGCFSNDGSDSVSNTLDGVELQIKLEKQHFALGEEVVSTILVTNHNNHPMEFYVPIPAEMEEGVAAVLVTGVIGQENQTLWQLLTPRNDDKVSNIIGRTYYGFVHVELGANETIEQDYVWNQVLFDQASYDPDSNEFVTVQAEAGKYIVSSSILLDEIVGEEDHFEIDKQLTSKMDIAIK